MDRALLTDGEAGIVHYGSELLTSWYELAPFQGYSGVQGTTSDGMLLNAKIPNQQAKQMDDDAAAIMDDTPLL